MTKASDNFITDTIIENYKAKMKLFAESANERLEQYGKHMHVQLDITMEDYNDSLKNK